MTDALLEGFKKYCEEHGGLMRHLAQEGQHPDYFIISCIDSRSNPGTIFQPRPGTFMAHKAMGAIVRPYKKGTALAAALQFALHHNHVKKIVLLGHTGCGAIKALVDKIDDEEVLSFVEVAQEALTRARKLCGDTCSYEQLLRMTEEQIVLQSTQNLKTYPSVQKALKEGNLEISPWLFDMDTGMLLGFSEKTRNFEPITDNKLKPQGHSCAHC